MGRLVEGDGGGSGGDVFSIEDFGDLEMGIFDAEVGEGEVALGWRFGPVEDENQFEEKHPSVRLFYFD